MYNNKFESQISFEPIIKNYENSLRGIVYDKGKYKKIFPESAGSRFISKWISHLRTILIGINSISKLDVRTCKQRILANGEAFIISMIVDETVSSENMTSLSQGFNNILIDSYLGLRRDGHFSKFLTSDHEDSTYEDETEGGLIEN